MLTDLDHVVSLDHVEELVLVRVDVEQRVERINLLDDRERAGHVLSVLALTKNTAPANDKRSPPLASRLYPGRP